MVEVLSTWSALQEGNVKNRNAASSFRGPTVFKLSKLGYKYYRILVDDIL